jgi:hypothetical protein
MPINLKAPHLSIQIRWMALTCLLILLTAWQSGNKQESRLPLKAVPVATCTDFHWISFREILLIRREKASPYTWKLSRYDLINKRERPLPALSALYNQFAPTDTTLLSPDGQWLLWDHERLSHTPTYDRAQAILARLDGKKHFTCSIGSSFMTDGYSPNPLHWMPDGKHWVEFQLSNSNDNDEKYPAQALVRRIDADRVVQTLDFVGSYVPRDIDVLNLTKNRLLVPPDQNFHLDIDEYRIGKDIRRLHQHKVPFPGLSFVWGMAVSPRTQRIAWLLDYEKTGPGTQNLQEWLGVWISDVEGKHLREIVSTLAGSDVQTRPDLDNVRWSPDGMQLGFLYGEMLYTVRVD